MKILTGLAACMLPLISVAEFVVPIESVDEYVNVRMVPDAKSEIVGRLYKGDAARIVQSLPEWYEIEIAGGATGFISGDWTVVVNENPPVAESGKEAGNAGSSGGEPTSVTHNDTRVNGMKWNVTALSTEEALAALDNLEPVTFNYVRNEQVRHIGFTAGNVPELVASSKSEGLMPLEIVAVLTRIVKLQQNRIEQLEARLGEHD